MPAQFCFIKSNGENEMLNTIDDKIAEFLGETPNKEYCVFMDNVSDMGFSILMRMEGSTIDKEKFDKWLSDVQSRDPSRHEAIVNFYEGKLIPCLRKFLYEDYTFKAWR